MRFIQSVFKVQVAGCCSGFLTSLSLNLKASSISSAESSSVTSPSSKSWSKVAGSFLAFKKKKRLLSYAIMRFAKPSPPAPLVVLSLQGF